MAELTTIARPYAEAAFRIARDANALPVWSQMLRFVSDVVADPQVAAALDNPKLTAADKEALLLSIGGERLDATGRNFVRVLVEADRIAVLPQIRDAVRGAEERRRRRRQGADRQRVPALRRASSPSSRRRWKSASARRSRRPSHVDPALVGGARITVGDTVIDGTIEAQLAAMATQLRA